MCRLSWWVFLCRVGRSLPLLCLSHLSCRRLLMGLLSVWRTSLNVWGWIHCVCLFVWLVGCCGVFVVVLQYSGWSQRPTLLQICTHSSENVFISPSFLKDIFPEFKILYRQHFSFGTLENVFAFSSGRYDFCWESHSLCIFVPNKEPVSIFGCFKFSFFVFRLVSVLVTLVWVWISFVYLAWDLLSFCSI